MKYLNLGIILIILLASCAGQHGTIAPLAPDSPEMPALTAGLPPLPRPGSPVPPYRQTSAGMLQVLGDASSSSGGTGNSNHQDAANHTLSLVPGGDDALAYAVYTVPNLSVDRPVQLGITASLLHPGGDDALEYWVMVSNYSTGQWKLSAGPNPDKSFSDASITLNSATLRDRLVSAQQGATDPMFSFAIVTFGNQFNSAGKQFDQQPRVEISLSTTTVLPQTDPGYFMTAPLPAQLSGATPDSQSGSIALSVITDTTEPPARVYVQRRIAGSQQWLELGYLSGSNTLYVDPADNSLPGATAPQPGLSYVYRAIAATQDGVLELRAGPSNELAATLSGNLPPVAHLTALPTVVAVDEPVQFDATASFDPDGELTDYEWDFDGDGIFNEPGDELTARGNPEPATYFYMALGNYFAAVRITDDGGLTAIASQLITVNAAPSAVLAADVAAGLAPLTVNFDASASSDSDGTIVNYEWDFDGDAVFNDAGNGEAAAQGNAQPTFVYNSPGAYLAAVRVTDNAGAQSYMALPIVVQAWSNLTVDLSSGVGQFASLAVVNGCPAIAYYDSASLDLKYAFSSNPDGSGSWTALSVDGPDNTGQFCSLAVVAGKPAISYWDSSSDNLQYAYSSAVDGNGGWSTLTVDGFGTDVGNGGTSLCVVDGKPAISYYDATNSQLKYAYSSLADGSGGWSTVAADGSDDVGTGSSLAVVNGYPAISYRDIATSSLKYAYSSLADGSGGWTELSVDAAADVGANTSLAVINGFPAIAYNDATNAALKYAWSTVPDGSGGWAALTVDAQASASDVCSLQLINGFPAIGYRDGTGLDLKFAFSGVPDGSSAWLALTLDSAGDVGSDVSLAEVNGLPALGYFDATSGHLKYAWQQ